VGGGGLIDGISFGTDWRVSEKRMIIKRRDEVPPIGKRTLSHERDLTGSPSLKYFLEEEGRGRAFDLKKEGGRGER